jgi:hypothetical protein
MPAIQFTIDAATGALEVEVHGLVGPACEDVAKLAKELLGEPGREDLKPEYHLRPRVHRQVRP